MVNWGRRSGLSPHVEKRHVTFMSRDESNLKVSEMARLATAFFGVS